MPGALRAAVVRHRCRVDIARTPWRFAGKPSLVRPLPARSPHRASAPVRPAHRLATKRNSRSSMRRTTSVSMLANAAPTQRLTPPPNGIHGDGLRVGADVSVRVERRRVREALLRVVGQLDTDDDVGALRKDPVPQSDSRLCAPCRAVENRPGALHLPDRGLPQFRSAGVGFLGQPRQQLGMTAQPLQRPGQR